MTRIERAEKAAHWSDVDHLQKLALPGDKPYITSRGAWWVAYSGKEAVAFCGVVASHRWTDAMYLCRAGVAPRFRGLGLQKRMLRVREAHARRNGMNWLITDTYNNPASGNSLISCGFKLWQPSVPWCKPGATYWRKRLTPL